jgi:plastocyanin
MRQRNLMIGAALAASLFVATACSSSSSSTSPAAGATSTTPNTSSPAATDVADVTGKSSFTVTQNNFFFSPSTIDGSAGQKITFTVKNAGTLPHTFTIDSMNVDVTVEPGTETTVDVTFPASGTVQFYCKFHKAMGMVGTLQVA